MYIYLHLHLHYLTAFFLSEAFFFRLALALIHFIQIVQRPAFLPIGGPDFVARVAALPRTRFRAVATQALLLFRLFFERGVGRQDHIFAFAKGGSSTMQMRH